MVTFIFKITKISNISVRIPVKFYLKDDKIYYIGLKDLNWIGFKTGSKSLINSANRVNTQIFQFNKN